MAAGTYNITIEQGTTWSIQLQVDQPSGTDVDLTNYTFDAKIAKSYYDESPVSMTTALVNATEGSFTLTLSAAQTSALDSNSKYIWDVDMTSPGGVVTRLLQGRATVSPEL